MTLKLVQTHEGELAVMAGIIQDPEMFHTIEGFDPEFFIDKGHRVTAYAFQELMSAGITPDIFNILKMAEGMDPDFKKQYGLKHLDRYLNTPVVTHNVAYWYAKVKENALLRNEQIETGNHVKRLANGEYESTESVISYLQERVAFLSKLTEEETKNDGTFSELIKEFITDVEQRFEGKIPDDFIPTGFKGVDELLQGGYFPQTLNIIAARPAMGKTAYALQLASQVMEHTPVAFFSLEMSRKDLISRIMSLKGRIYSSKYKTPKKMTEEDFFTTHKVIQDMAKYADNLIINDKPNASIDYIESKSIKYVREHGVRMIIIDYLQLMGDSNKEKELNREQSVSSKTIRLRTLARRLGIPIISLAQLNRLLEQRPDKRPRPSDLRESGALEQEADLIQFLYRDEVYNPDTPDKGVCEIITGKNRHGGTETVKMIFEPEFTLFKEIPKDYTQEV